MADGASRASAAVRDGEVRALRTRLFIAEDRALGFFRSRSGASGRRALSLPSEHVAICHGCILQRTPLQDVVTMAGEGGNTQRKHRLSGVGHRESVTGGRSTEVAKPSDKNEFHMDHPLVTQVDQIIPLHKPGRACLPKRKSYS